MSDIVSSLVHPSGCKSVRYVSEIPSHYVKCNCLYFRPLRLENDYGRYNLKNVFRFCPACVEESSRYVLVNDWKSKQHWSHYVIWERTCFSDLLLYRRRPTYNIDILNLFISSLFVLKGLPPFLPLHGCTSRVVCAQKHLRVACIVFLMGRNCHLQMSVLLWIWGWAKIEWNGNRQMPPTQCECGQAAKVRSRMQMNVMERLQLRNSMPLEKV